ncbi:MAG: hypothetical protein U1E51_20360, partial [Candidatus Binatia bacterium]|nr:hypothetical protein [Candidatus Binatia bacterium]
IKRQIDAALERVNAEISANARQGHIAAGLASEGYAGGYRDALYDVLLVLNGGKPKRRDYW